MSKSNLLQHARWGVRPILESSEELLSMLERHDLYLPSIQSMSQEHRKQEWLTVRVLLKELLEEEKEICYTPAGKPYLSDHSFQIGITHTRGYVAIILDPHHPVGIDMEYLSPRIRKIRSRFMNEKEEADLDNEMEDIHLLLHWSAKETLFKTLGVENVEFRQQLHIRPFKPVLNKLDSFSAFETRTENNYSFTIHYLAQTDYVLTFCILSANKQ